MRDQVNAHGAKAHPQFAGALMRNQGYIHRAKVHPQFAGALIRNQGDIHVKVTVNSINTVWVCGTVGESLKHTIFYLDKNIEKEGLVGYTPTAGRVKWEHKKYMNGECTIHEMPNRQQDIMEMFSRDPQSANAMRCLAVAATVSQRAIASCIQATKKKMKPERATAAMTVVVHSIVAYPA